MRSQSLVFLCLAAIVDSRVSFIFSEVLDSDDINIGDQAPFQCPSGCRVFSPDDTDLVVIYDSTGREYYSMKDLSKLKLGEYYELPARPEPYMLKKRDRYGPTQYFTLYIIEKGSPNYDTQVLYVKASEKFQIRGKSLMTIMSSTGAIYFSDFSGDFSDYLPTVHATGVDALSLCRPVYKARSVVSLANTAFPLFSPLATIDFTQNWGGKSVRVSGDPNGVISTGINTTSVFSSPGYVGCGKDTRYSWPHKRIDGFNSSFTVQDDKGLTVHVEGEYSIYSEGGEVTLSVNEIEEKLNGANISYAMDYEPLKKKSPVQIGVQWKRQNWTPDGNEYSKDWFALQIDVLSKPGKNDDITTKSAPITKPTTPVEKGTRSQAGNIATTNTQPTTNPVTLSTTEVGMSTTVQSIITAKHAEKEDKTTTVHRNSQSVVAVQTTVKTPENEDKSATSKEPAETTTKSGRSLLTITGSSLMLAYYIMA